MIKGFFCRLRKMRHVSMGGAPVHSVVMRSGKIDDVPARSIFEPCLAPQRVSHLARVPFDVFAYPIDEFLRRLRHSSKWPNGDDGDVVGLRHVHLETDDVALLYVPACQRHERIRLLGLRDQFFLDRFLPAGGRDVLRFAAVYVEEAADAVEKLEKPEVILVLCEAVSDEDPDRIVLIHRFIPKPGYSA